MKISRLLNNTTWTDWGRVDGGDDGGVGGGVSGLLSGKSWRGNASGLVWGIIPKNW